LRLLIDEMFPAAVAEGLRSRGYDAVSVAEREELKGLPDDDIFTAARSEGRTLVTENVRDFRPISRDWIRAGKVHHGLVFTSNRRFPRAQERTLGSIIVALVELIERSDPSAEPSNREVWL
jgi:predicted nuclease of predicted toxin-antitoxin system